MGTSKTCPDCRKTVTKMPSRVYPNFDVNDEDVTSQLANNVEELENRNKKLEKQLNQLHADQSKLFVAQLAEKTCEVVKAKNSMKLLQRLYIDAKRKNDELSKTNEEVTETLNLCRGKLNSINDLLFNQHKESTNLILKVRDLEKQLQFAESDAQMDKYFRTMAVREKEEVIDQLNETQCQLHHAQNTIDGNFLQIECILSELDTLRTEKRMQLIKEKQMEQIIYEHEKERKEIELENVQLKKMIQGEINSNIVSEVVAQKRKSNECCNVDRVNKYIKQEYKVKSIDNSVQPPIRLIFRKNKGDSHFSCVPVL